MVSVFLEKLLEVLSGYVALARSVDPLEHADRTKLWIPLKFKFSYDELLFVGE
jgi:hypothetical protein